MKFPETNSDNVLSMVNFLKQELQEHHIEFFRFGDDVKNSGLVNHAPLTLLASCILGAHANHLPTFIEKYKQVLKDFKCALVPPIPSTNTLSDLLPQNEVIDKCRNNPEYTVSLRDYFFTQIKKKGLKNTIQQVLPVAVVKGCFLAKFFHAILLCIFPVHLYEVISECGDSILKQGEDSMYHLSASGLALLFTTPDPLHILEFNENLDSGIKSVPSKDQISENINSFMNSDAWKNWYSAAETEIAKPFYLFGITSYFEYFSKDETKPCQKLFEEYLDIDAQLIKNNREQVICSLAEYVLEYYAEGQGFLALHIVSATCALVILSSFIEDDEDFALISRKLWHFIAFAMISSIEAAKREGITGVTRARGERSTPVEESEWEAADKDWNSLIRNALNTECAHSIKLVYAVRTIWNFIETNNRQTEECENTAKYCAFVATCYRIP